MSRACFIRLPGSIQAALSEARIYADKVDCVTARQKFTELQTSYPGSVEIAPTDAYLIGKGC